MKHKGFNTASSKYTDEIDWTAIYLTTDVCRKTWPLNSAFPFKDIIKKENLIWFVKTKNYDAPLWMQII